MGRDGMGWPKGKAMPSSRHDDEGVVDTFYAAWRMAPTYM